MRKLSPTVAGRVDKKQSGHCPTFLAHWQPSNLQPWPRPTVPRWTQTPCRCFRTRPIVCESTRSWPRAPATGATPRRAVAQQRSWLCSSSTPWGTNKQTQSTPTTTASSSPRATLHPSFTRCLGAGGWDLWIWLAELAENPLRPGGSSHPSAILCWCGNRLPWARTGSCLRNGLHGQVLR